MKKKPKKKIIICIIVFLVLISAGVVAYFATFNIRSYYWAKNQMKTGNYDDAENVFIELEEYKDSPKLLEKCYYQQGLHHIKQKEYSEALSDFKKSVNKKNSNLLEQMHHCYYQLGQIAYKEKNYEEAASYFGDAFHYKDAYDLYQETTYLYGKELLREYDYEMACATFGHINYKDSDALYNAYISIEEDRFTNGRFYYQPEEFVQFLSDQMLNCSAKLLSSENGEVVIDIYRESGDKSSVQVTLQGVDKEEFTFEKIQVFGREALQDPETFTDCILAIMMYMPGISATDEELDILLDGKNQHTIGELNYYIIRVEENVSLGISGAEYTVEQDGVSIDKFVENYNQGVAHHKNFLQKEGDKELNVLEKSDIESGEIVNKNDLGTLTITRSVTDPNRITGVSYHFSLEKELTGCMGEYISVLSAVNPYAYLGDQGDILDKLGFKAGTNTYKRHGISYTVTANSSTCTLEVVITGEG